MTESELEMAARHVAQGTDQIQRQRQILTSLTRDGHVDLAEVARELLRLLEESGPGRPPT